MRYNMGSGASRHLPNNFRAYMQDEHESGASAAEESGQEESGAEESGQESGSAE